MKLYYQPGTCSLASHIILNELETTFTLEKTDTASGMTNSGQKYAEINPNGYVPALQIDQNTVITENPAILQYLGNLQPELGLVPDCGSFEHTRLQEVLNFLSSELHKAFSPYFSGTELSDEEKNTVNRKIEQRINTLETRLADGRLHLLGEKFTVADAYAFVILNWSNFIGFSLDAWPNIASYIDRVRTRPATKMAMTTEGLLDPQEAP